jgi:arylsulfatase B
LLSVDVSIVLAQPPNIILILADDLGYNDVSWHNDAVIMPHLAQLAREGVILEQHYTQAVCSPTRGALLTGRYPIHNGLYNGVISPLMPYGLDTSFTTLPEELRRANYTTHIVGKWHLGFCNKKFWPTNRGFDHHYGFMCGGSNYFSHEEGRYGGYDFWDDEEVSLADNGTYSTTLIQQRAVEVISTHDDSKPLFMYIPFQAVHSPLQVPDVYRNMYSDIEDEDRRTYLGMVTAMDDAVGNITAALKLSNLYDNSIIVFFSDNGGPVQGWPPLQKGYGANNWPLRGAKLTMWEGGTRTVAFAHAPKYLSPRTSTNWMHVTDWFPTLLSIAGLSPTSPDLDGLDQWAQLQDASLDSPRKEMIYNIFYPNTPPFTGGPPVAAIRVGDWKYIHRTIGYSGWAEAPESGVKNEQFRDITDTRNMLFNLATDPEEKENLFDVEPEVAADIQAKLDKYIQALPDGGYPPKDPAWRPENFGEIWNAGWC